MDYEQELLREMSKSLERLDVSMDNLQVILGKQEVHLAEHIRRTALLEKQMEGIQKHVNTVNALILGLGGLFAILAAIKTVIEIVKLF